MARTIKNILFLNHEEEMDFFMKSEQYLGFELPEYFTFDEILRYVRKTIGDATFEECLQEGTSPEFLHDVNLDILLNKDGRYAVRPIVLANPFLYYFLVREICNERSWEIVKGLFEKFKVPHLTLSTLPVISNREESFYKSTTIFNWWNSMEQRSIELSLEYRYMFVYRYNKLLWLCKSTNIRLGFQSQGYTIRKAMHAFIAKNIQKYLRAFQQGRNIGIPQGSSIFDFIGEIVLGYSDLLLHEAIERAYITSEYEIIRYREDYRIFCNDKDVLEKISYIYIYIAVCVGKSKLLHE